MTDNLGRNIDYMRLSITDKCNLRCKYCMPEPREFIPHEEILSYEEFLKIAEAAVKLGITKFKVTGGEPLVRKDAVSFIKRLKNLSGVEKVTLTTNGILLGEHLDELAEAGIDGINISLDAVSREKYRDLTGDLFDFDPVLLERCTDKGINLKLNTVLLNENADEWLKIIEIAEELPIDIRFIELMPIGYADTENAPDADTLLSRIIEKYPDLEETDEVRGNGPAVYYKSDYLKGRIGIIGANSHKFCDNCNRIRLTGTGIIKPCLSYDIGTDLKTPLRNGADMDEITKILESAIKQKPHSHCFENAETQAGKTAMHKIGG